MRSAARFAISSMALTEFRVVLVSPRWLIKKSANYLIV